MKNTIITLTPPIDGVQYGVSDELIKVKNWYFYNSSIDLCKSSGDYYANAKKIICSTNPKDLRFPYLQIVCPTCGKIEWGVCSNSWHKNILPSKEQEVEYYYIFY